MLNTGRLLEHWHTGSMTRRSFALDAISPNATVFISADDAERLGIADGEFARVTSRRGSIELEARVSHRETPGSCFIPFHFREAAANLLTIDEIDPVGKIPEFKFCAVRVEPARRRATRRRMADGSDQRHACPGVEARAGKFPGPSLIPALNAIQREHGWLPREELVRLSRETRRPLYEIEGLISFYPHFRTEPPPKVDLHVCHDLSCWLHGADERIAEVRQRYGDDVEIEVREVSCIGRCDIAPAATVQRAAGHAGGSGDRRRAARGGDRRAADPARRRVMAERPLRRRAEDRYARAARDDRRRAHRRAGDRRRSRSPGCAGWAAPASRPAPSGRSSPASREPKYVICNADESEPGTFKDRQILAEQPHLVIEGMLLGMLATGAEQGWVFIRHEYGPEEAAVRAELDALREAGLLGEDVLGSRPAPGDRHLHLPRRLHPRRGVRADRVHGGPPRRAAQQAAVPRRLRPVGQADADELGRDVRRRPDHPRARRAVVEGPGRQRRHRPEVLCHLRPHRPSRRVLRADGHNRPRAHRAGRRPPRRRRAAGLPAGRSIVELPRPRAARRRRSTSSRWPTPARCSAPARSW